jgi:putative transcriptional regulator
MSDRRFTRSLIFVCVHNPDGAMGIVVNRLVGSLTYAELMQQLNIEGSGADDERQVHFGGPMETSRGFVLHSTDRIEEGTLLVDDDIALTSTTDILRAIVAGEGPQQSLLALGYAGWGPGQLDAELHANAWLCVDADEALLFDRDLDTKWHRAIAKRGFDVNMLSGEAGHA